jgi:hypothetical protein
VSCPFPLIISTQYSVSFLTDFVSWRSYDYFIVGEEIIPILSSKATLSRTATELAGTFGNSCCQGLCKKLLKFISPQ